MYDIPKEGFHHVTSFVFCNLISVLNDAMNRPKLGFFHLFKDKYTQTRTPNTIADFSPGIFLPAVSSLSLFSYHKRTDRLALGTPSFTLGPIMSSCELSAQVAITVTFGTILPS
jgi:hypothetical protein